ncbi:MAG: S41 family peptidase [Bacteroidaceae bacterium]|nr:S41 family peptidase [Bacteroidaceae bacterium]
MKRAFKISLRIIAGLVVFLIIAFGALFILARCNPEFIQRLFEEKPIEYISFSQLPQDRDSMKTDFDGIHKIVVEKYSLYRQKGISMDSLYNVYAARLRDSVLTSDDYGRMLLEYFADLHCGHATTYFCGQHYGGAEPIYIEERLFLDKPGDYICGYGFHDKDEIIAINGKSIPAWMADNIRFHGSSTIANKIWETAVSALTSYTDTLLNITVARGSDTLLLPLPLHAKGYPNPNICERKVLQDSIGYIAVHTMTNGVVEVFDSLYQSIKSLPYLIVDIRRNGGGNSDNGIRLCEYLLKREKLHCLYDETIKPRSDAYRGKVFLLIDTPTFSAAESFALDLWESGEVTLIGNPTGGDTGNGPEIFQSSAGLFFRIPLREPLRSPNGFPLEGRGVPPHYEVAQTVKDFMAGVDTQLAFTLDLIQK